MEKRANLIATLVISAFLFACVNVLVNEWIIPILSYFFRQKIMQYATMLGVDILFGLLLLIPLFLWKRELAAELLALRPRSYILLYLVAVAAILILFPSLIASLSESRSMPLVPSVLLALYFPINIFWQDFLMFGVAQSALRTHFSYAKTVIVVLY
jgi:hypothetical protein